MLLSDETNEMDQVRRQEGPTITQRQASLGTKALPHLALLDQYLMILEETRTRKRTIVSRNVPPRETVTRLKRQVTSVPEMALTKIEEVSL